MQNGVGTQGTAWQCGTVDHVPTCVGMTLSLQRHGHHKNFHHPGAEHERSECEGKGRDPVLLATRGTVGGGAGPWSFATGDLPALPAVAEMTMTTGETRSQTAGRPFCISAASTVFFNRQAMVIGPTPPGTGVMAPATGSALA